MILRDFICVFYLISCVYLQCSSEGPHVDDRFLPKFDGWGKECRMPQENQHGGRMANVGYPLRGPTVRVR